jgi:hypothetical protein
MKVVSYVRYKSPNNRLHKKGPHGEPSRVERLGLRTRGLVDTLPALPTDSTDVKRADFFCHCPGDCLKNVPVQNLAHVGLGYFRWKLS